MAKRRRKNVSDDAATPEQCYTAFIDTSLDTHLAMIISSSDTVADLKKKIACEHSQLFSGIGEINVLSLQVKRQGHLYHLPDSMLVVSVYEGSKRHKFLFVDASSAEEHDREQRYGGPDSVGQFGLLQLENYPHVNERNLLSDDPSKSLSLVHELANGKAPNAVQASPRNIYGEISKAIEMEVSHVDDGCQRDLSPDITRKSHLRVSKESLHDHVKHIQMENLEALSSESGFASKKRKTEHNENGVRDSVVKANSTSFHTKRSSSDHEIVNIGTALADAGKSVPNTIDVRQKEVGEDLYKISSSDTNNIVKSGAPTTSQSEPAAQTSHKVGSEELVGDNSDYSNWEKVTKLAKCITDRQEVILGSNVTSEQIKDDQLGTSLFSRKKGKKKRKNTSSVSSDQADISESIPVQNVEKEHNFDGNLELGHKDLDNLVDSAIVSGQSFQPETFSRPSVLSLKGTCADLIHGVVDERKTACSLEGNAEGKIIAVDQAAELGVNAKTSSMKPQSLNVEDFASLVITGDDDMNKVTTWAHEENIHIDSLDYVGLQTDRKGQMEMVLNQDCQVMPSEKFKNSDEGDVDETNKESILMPKLITTSGPIKTLVPEGAKRKKKKKKKKKKSAKKNASGVQTDSAGEQTNKAGANSSSMPELKPEDHINENADNNESMLPPAEIDQSNKVEEETGLLANQDPQGKTSECFKRADCVEAAVSTREAVISTDFLGSNEAMEVGNSSGKKRKRRKTKRSADKIEDISEMEHDVDIIRGISLPVQAVSLDNQITDYNNNCESNVPCMETDQTTAIAGDKGLSMEHETEVTLPAGSKPLNFCETNADVDNSATTAMLSNAKDVKSSSRLKKRRTTKSAVISQDGSGMVANTQNDFSMVTDSPVNNVADETKNPRSILPRNVQKEASKDKSMGDSASGAYVEVGKVSYNEAVHFPSIEIDGSQENGGEMGEIGREVLENNRSGIDNGIHDLPVEGQTNELQVPQLNQSHRNNERDGNVNKKAKKKKNKFSAAEILSSSEIKGPSIVAEELAASGDKSGADYKPSSAAKTSGLAERTVIQSTISDLELEKNAAIESNSSNPEDARKDANPSEVPFKGRPETGIDNENNTETAKGKEEGIDFRHYFVLEQHQNEITSSVKVKEKSQSKKPKRKKEKHNVVSESEWKSSENHGDVNESDRRNIDDNQVDESASSDEHNRDSLRGNKKTLKASEYEGKAPSSREVVEDKTFQKAAKPAVVNDNGASRTASALLGENKGPMTAPSSSSISTGSKSVVENASKRKQQSSYNRNAGDVLNSAGRDKSLLTTPRAIFREDSSESSGDENKIVNSDAGTRTPSDSSSSSGYTDGESELIQDSKRNGSVKATTKGSGQNNILNSKFSGPQEMSLDMILRSSSRFKKAKLSASQSQAEDTESQPVDFVPDSQANQ